MYTTAEREFLKPISDAVGVPPERWFLVPGNHDVDREKLLLLPAAALKISNRDELNRYLSDPDFVDVPIKPTRAYSACCERFLGARAADSYSYAISQTFIVNGNSVGLAGLNSAMLCGLHKVKVEEKEEVDDYGRLVLGEHQIEKALSAISRRGPADRRAAPPVRVDEPARRAKSHGAAFDPGLPLHPARARARIAGGGPERDGG
jgi:hypothetical protein